MRRMMVGIPPRWKHLWTTWDLRGFIILSLCLQMFLSLFAPLRKRTSTYLIIIPLWSAYLLADWVASYSLGLITKGKGDPNCFSNENGCGVDDTDQDLIAFWAPFLLVHLGGPDTITAFALEDNEFWIRHLISLVIQCFGTVYVLVKTPPHNPLWVPTTLMFMNGIIKYSERTIAFYLASASRFKKSMNTNTDSSLDYMEVMEKFLLKEEAKVAPVTISQPPRSLAKEQNLTEFEVLQYAYCFFSTFKGLAVDLIFTQRTRNQSRNFFLNRTAKDAFEVVELELNFIYEVLFTKIPVLYGYFGVIFRIFSFVTVCVAAILFVFQSKSNFSNVDVRITYGLLFSALALDIVGLLVLVLSKRTLNYLLRSHVEGKTSLWTRFLGIFHIRTVKGMFKMRTSEPKTHRWPVGFPKRRWSESVPTYKLIYCCLHPHSSFHKSIYDILGLGEFVDLIKYVKAKRFTVNLRDFIFEELKIKSNAVDDLQKAMDISSSQGDWVLRDEGGWSRLLPYTLDVDYGQRIILWHIATDLCYHKELDEKLKSKGQVDTNRDNQREIAKLLSDYMMYLLIMKPSMMTAVTSMVQGKFSDVCTDVTCIFKSGKIHQVNDVRQQTQKSGDTQVDTEQLNACMKIFAIPEEVWQRNVKGDLQKSLLPYCVILAKEIMKIEAEDKRLNKWLIISKVWVDLLCYGASHSHAKIQSAQVNSGGELITIVWLLMAHFGLGDQFQINQHQERARSVV